MTTPAPEALGEISPHAQDFVAAVAASPTAPVKKMVSGGIGTGKSSVLTAVRTALRDAGLTVLTWAPRRDDPAGAAIVIDDAHLLDDDALTELTERVADADSTVIVATEPLAHHPAIRGLTTALERENPLLELRALTLPELTEVAATLLGATPAPEVVRTVLSATAGLPFLVRPALAAVAAATDGEPVGPVVARAARVALVERLHRLDEPVLDTLLICSLSPELGADDVAAALRVTPEAAHTLVDRARATGLLDQSLSPGFLRTVHRGVAQLSGTARHHEIELSLLTSQIEMSTLSADLALRMAEHGLHDDRLAEALAELAGRARGQPTRAARLYRAAADAGATALSARLADALALSGDCTTAARLADELLTSDDPAERAAAVRIGASIAVHDGSAGQAAELFRWLGPYPDAFVSAAGAMVAVAAGEVGAARTALHTDHTGPPTTTARAARSIGDGLLASLDQPYPVAVTRLSQSISVAEQHPPGVAPDSPAALVTLVALHGGDPVRARSVISRAVRTGNTSGGPDPASQPGAPDAEFFVHRHRLLLGWVRMLDGQLTAAGADIGRLPLSELHRRDALWAAALQTAIARRAGDTGAMQKHWYTAMEVLAEYSIDLFSLLPLGELWVAAARMRQVDRLRHTLDEAFGLLEAAGNPVLWSAPLHWAGVHAGILANAPDAVAPHGHALTAASRDEAADSALAKALAHAGRTWLRVLANHVDTDEVTTAARALSQVGLTWDATRLAGQAALHTPDSRISGAMLQLARDLKQAVDAQEPPDADTPEAARAPLTAAAAATRPSAPRLSEREREVAELLLRGLPYREIGNQLFISAKTVEHHVARIRRRLGAQSRSEMLSMLRALLEPQG
ncbi:isoniazid response ATPase/transcriptional regulator IniR [Mycolicibacterium thermoresistibile]